jgi:1,6-anhydro-N-acetylmuramate kinase
MRIGVIANLGGIANVTILRRDTTVTGFDTGPANRLIDAWISLHPDYVEAVAFAWFARRTLDGLTSSAGSVTGAAGARILGGVYRCA